MVRPRHCSGPLKCNEVTGATALATEVQEGTVREPALAPLAYLTLEGFLSLYLLSLLNKHLPPGRHPHLPSLTFHIP